MTVCDLRQARDLNPRTLFFQGKAFPNIFPSPILLRNMLIISNSSSQEQAGESDPWGTNAIGMYSVTVELSMASESRRLHLI